MFSYLRWRHSRGFGIHSPFAYDLIREALHPGRGYIYYDEMLHIRNEDWREAPGLPLHPHALLRLAIFLRQRLFPNSSSPKMAIISSSNKNQLRQLERIANAADFQFLPSETCDADLLIIPSGITPPSGKFPENWPPGNRPAAILTASHDENTLAKLRSSRHGLIIHARNYTLLISRPEMVLTEYKIL